MKVVHAHPEKIKYCDPVDGRFPPIKLLAWLVRAYRPKDRTGLFNNLNFEYSPIPKVESGWRKTFDTCCYDRAEELWSVGKPITLFWSGGIDSTAAFVALAQTKKSTDILKVRCVPTSIEEYPDLSTGKAKPFLELVAPNELWPPSLFENNDILKVTGECGDTLFGGRRDSTKFNALQDWPWQKLLEIGSHIQFMFPNQWLWGGITTQTLIDLEETLNKITEVSPVPIKTVFDLYWWIHLIIKWEDVLGRIPLIWVPTKHWETTSSFFNTEDFQKWSISNQHTLQVAKEVNYKQQAKDFIYNYTKDNNYRQGKTKAFSMRKVMFEVYGTKTFQGFLKERS